MLNFFTFSPTNISAAVLVFNLVFITAISFLIAVIYKKTHSGLSYSQSFFITLVMVAPIAMVVILIVQNNIYGALGLLGAFALIRFRTIVKETRDISFLFFSLVEGVAVGSGHYSAALISTIFIALVAIVLSKFKFGTARDDKHVLTIITSAPLQGENISNTAQSFGVSMHLLSTRKIDKEYEYIYSTHAKTTQAVEQYLLELDKNVSLISYDLVSGKDAVEY